MAQGRAALRLVEYLARLACGPEELFTLIRRDARELTCRPGRSPTGTAPASEPSGRHSAPPAIAAQAAAAPRIEARPLHAGP